MSHNFYGRANEIEELLTVLADSDVDAIIMYGHRYMGKTSILQAFSENLLKNGEGHPIYFNLQDKASSPLMSMLSELARLIVERLDLDQEIIEGLSPDTFHSQFLEEVFDNLPPGERIVLLLDHALDKEQRSETFLAYLPKLASVKQLEFVLAVDDNNPDELMTLLQPTFRHIHSFHLSRLNRDSTIRLLKEECKPLNWSDSQALDRIWQLTQGHPYLTKQLGTVIWEIISPEMGTTEIVTVSPEIINKAISQTLERSAEAINWIWDELSSEAHLVASALAEAGPRVVPLTELQALLTGHDITNQDNALQTLQKWNLLEQSNGGYRFQLELVRQWISKYKPLKPVEHAEQTPPETEAIKYAINKTTSLQNESYDDDIEDGTKKTISPSQIVVGLIMLFIIIVVVFLPNLRNILRIDPTEQVVATEVVSAEPTPTEEVVTPDPILTEVEVSPEPPVFVKEFSNDDQVWSVAFNRDQTVLAAGLGDGTIVVWEVDNLSEIEDLPRQVFTEHSAAVKSIAFDPQDKNRLASGSADNTIKLWHLATEESIATFEEHTEEVSSVAFSPDGTLLASGSEAIKLWDLDKQELKETFTGHNESVLSVAFDPKGNRLASGSEDHSIRIWDVDSQESIKTFTDHKDWVVSVAFNPTGTRLASASDDETVRLWDIERGRSELLTGIELNIVSVAFTPDGKWLALGSDNKTILLWDLDKQELLSPLERHTGAVRSVAFSPEGNLLASGSEDGMVHLWQVQSE